MTEPHVIDAPALEVSSEPEPVPGSLSASPKLISEQELALSTAAALGVQARASRGWLSAIRALAAVPVGMFWASTADSHREPRYYPRHYRFIENARMAREMQRL